MYYQLLVPTNKNIDTTVETSIEHVIVEQEWESVIIKLKACRDAS